MRTTLRSSVAVIALLTNQMASAQEGFLQVNKPHRQLGWDLVPEPWDIDYVDPEEEAKKADLEAIKEEAAKLEALLEEQRS